MDANCTNWANRTDGRDGSLRRAWFSYELTNDLPDFGAPLDSLDIAETDFTREDIVARLGLPPNRMDILTGVSGVTFAEAWPGRVEKDLGDVEALGEE